MVNNKLLTYSMFVVVTLNLFVFWVVSLNRYLHVVLNNKSKEQFLVSQLDQEYKCFLLTSTL